MRKILALFILAVTFLIVNTQLASSFTIEPEQNRLVFQNIEYSGNSTIDKPINGHFRINNIKEYVNLFAYSGPYDGIIEFRKYPLVPIPNYPIKVYVNSDAVEICSSEPYQCGKQISTTFNRSTRFTVELTQQAFLALRSNSNAVEDFQIFVTIGEQNFKVLVSIDSFAIRDRGVPRPYDYFDFPYPWNLATSENITKVVYIAIILPIYLISLFIFRRKNNSNSLLIFIKLLILILASYLSTVVLTRFPDTKLSYSCSWSGYYDSHGIQGLPLPYNYSDLETNYTFQAIAISFNFWFWVIALIALIAHRNKNYLENNRFSFKKFIRLNKYFLIFTFVYFLLYKALGSFLGVRLMC